MNLSERAIQYFSTLKRNDQWRSKEQETKDYLIKNDISHFDEFLKYQMTYSGYKLTIKNDPKEDFLCHLFSNEQIKKGQPLEIEKAGNRLIEICGEHITAQFTYYLTEKGELCTLDDEDLPNILHSCFDKFIEQYALRNEIHFWDSNPYYFEIINLKGLEIAMSRQFDAIKECSDSFSTWWISRDLIAVKGVWLDRPEFYFHVYGKERHLCDQLIQKLKHEKILK